MLKVYNPANPQAASADGDWYAYLGMRAHYAARGDVDDCPSPRTLAATLSGRECEAQPRAHECAEWGASKKN